MTAKSHNDISRCCAFSPDGKLIAAGSSELTVWDTDTGKEKATLDRGSGLLESCSFSADGKRIATVHYDHTLNLWNAETFEELASLNSYGDRIRSCGFSNGTNRFVTGSNVKTLMLWDSEYGTKLALIVFDAEIHACAISGDGQKIACGDYAGNFYLFELMGFDPCVNDNKEKKENGILTNKENISRSRYDSQMNEFKNDFQNREEKYQIIYTNAEIAFNEKKWETAFNLYLNLVQQGKFDINLLRYKMIICKINCLTTNNTSVIGDINNLIELLQKNGAEDYVRMAIDNLNESLSRIPPEDLIKPHPGKPWWKKMF
jgi:WD40 repeat protein